MSDDSVIKEALRAAELAAASGQVDSVGLMGFGVVEHRDGDGALIEVVPFFNTVTTVGDEYYAKKGAANVGTPNVAPPTAVNGMKLGTGTTPPLKSGTASYIGATYILNSAHTFDSAYPQTSSAGTDAGWYITYKSTWLAGEATNSAITEVSIVNDRANNTSTGGPTNTISRATFTAVNKLAADTLAITWNHKFLGAA